LSEKRFAHDGIKTKMFMPEDIGYLDGVSAWCSQH
jgi:hypothetical protein